MPVPDFETLTLDRLQLCLAEISGIKRAYRLPPSEIFDIGNLPCAFVLVGAMVSPTPAVGGGMIEVARTYVVRVLIAPLGEASIDVIDDGSQGYGQAVPYIAKVRDYFMSKPRLSTSAAPPLSYLSQDVTLSDSGIVSRQGAGGAQYLAIDFSLVITARAKLTPSRIS